MVIKTKAINILSSRILQNLSSIILGGIFIYASIDKIIHHAQFERILLNYKLLPDYLISITAIILPWSEIILGTLLFLYIYPRKSALALSLLILIFITATLINVIRGLNINCGCFSTNPKAINSSGLQLIIRDIIILIPGIIIIFFNRKIDK